MALKMNETLNSDSQSSSQSYDHLILVDRDIDYYTLLLSPLNYIGLLDETFSVKCCKSSSSSVFSRLKMLFLNHSKG